MSPELIAAIERFEAVRTGPMCLEKLQAHKALRDLLAKENHGIIHNGARYFYGKYDSDFVRIPWGEEMEGGRVPRTPYVPAARRSAQVVHPSNRSRQGRTIWDV